MPRKHEMGIKFHDNVRSLRPPPSPPSPCIPTLIVTVRLRIPEEPPNTYVCCVTFFSAPQGLDYYLVKKVTSFIAVLHKKPSSDLTREPDPGETQKHQQCRNGRALSTSGRAIPDHTLSLGSRGSARSVRNTNAPSEHASTLRLANAASTSCLLVSQNAVSLRPINIRAFGVAIGLFALRSLRSSDGPARAAPRRLHASCSNPRAQVIGVRDARLSEAHSYLYVLTGA